MSITRPQAGDLFDLDRATRCLWSGSWAPASAELPVAAPATGERIAVGGAAGSGDVEVAAQRASEAQAAWAATSPDERAAVMDRAARLLERHREEAQSWLIVESGSSRMKASGEVDSSLAELREAATLPERVVTEELTDTGDRQSVMRRVPIGVVGVISPWNFPMVLSLRSVAPALVLGNAVVLKPDPHTAVSGGLFLAALFDAAGLPAGVLHVMPGGAEAGQTICGAPPIGMVSFTGSTSAGRKVGATASSNLKRVALELGGNSAFIVLDDADVDAASSAGAFGSFFHQGQICMASSRHLVHESVADRYVEALARRAGRLSVGDPAVDEVEIGPLINRRQFDRVQRIVDTSVTAGATALSSAASHAPYFHPTVLVDVARDMPVWREETFGPVAPVMTFSSDEEAVALANDTDYGLSSGVYTASTERGQRIADQLRTGMVHIGDQTVNDTPATPFGGMGASGNVSRFGGSANLEEFTQWQWITKRPSPAVYPFGG
jgi:benzaldehyde dehydrogenase (NAD)